MNTRGRAQHNPPLAASHHAFSSPDVSARSRHTLGSESATLAASSFTYHVGERATNTASVEILKFFLVHFVLQKRVVRFA
jgi:hypothetical protein